MRTQTLRKLGSSASKELWLLNFEKNIRIVFRNGRMWKFWWTRIGNKVQTVRDRQLIWTCIHASQHGICRGLDLFSARK